MTLILALVHAAYGQACVCSRSVALPSGGVSRAGEVVASLEYGFSLHGATDAWQGFSVTDLYGDSMAGMYMPPHIIQSISASASLGLPEGFGIAATLPFQSVVHVHPSGMEGDVDMNTLADADLTGRWGVTSKDMKRFAGVSAGVTLPTGTVIEQSPARTGRGTFGGAGGLQGGFKVHPKAAIAGAVSGSAGFGADSGGYAVAPAGNVILGARWSPRENGRLSFAGFGMLRWQGKDRQDALVYENSGFLTLDLAVATGFTFWEKAERSAALSARAQSPLWQVVGDPMYAENFSASLGISAVVF